MDQFNISNMLMDLQYNSTNGSHLRNNFTSNFSESLGVLITKYFFLGLLTLFGVVGNILVVVVTTKRKAFKSSLDLFIKNLAVADLGFLLLVSPPGVLRTVMPYRWPLGEFICLYIYPSVDIFHGASVWIIAAIAVERYRNIVGMARIRRESQTKRSAKILMVGVWVFSFLLFCIPVYVAIVFLQPDGRSTICTMRWSRGQQDNLVGTNIYIVFMVLFTYVIPLSVVTWTYVAISRQLRRSNTFLRGIKGIISRKTTKNITQVENCSQNFRNDSNRTANGTSFQNHSLISPSDSHRLAQNKRAKNILTPVAVLFAVSMLPISLLRIILIFWKAIIDENYYNIFFFLTVVFTAANSSLNPLVYSIVSREFRNALKSLFHKNKRDLSRCSASAFGQESTEHKRIDLSEVPVRKDSEETKVTNNSCPCIASDTKL
ncbi:galanin receptor type 1-like [Actinia tenebrosa]|uniref:Galanin receptor type 1-like n=1 Tax=Actinia tenebrosa TaxID=6105 RepID=A0A6P8H1J8_ACTTE|nr:galanin receptor type 1-like [Actinia tenebrosa]XP_031549276.1 galanin receptor type 1-like [Actinia tenebrosa]XP_031549277.1 galanin receptor type 1-like [Actinia tenebrosa]XP_031549278.1 galanin receptor type 1-like [Actinia tenebrosa]XP_031549279.1 galanin receptor type 1-like [Actinia tenebrosa]